MNPDDLPLIQQCTCNTETGVHADDCPFHTAAVEAATP